VITARGHIELQNMCHFSATERKKDKDATAGTIRCCRQEATAGASGKGRSFLLSIIAGIVFLG